MQQTNEYNQLLIDFCKETINLPKSATGYVDEYLVYGNNIIDNNYMPYTNMTFGYTNEFRDIQITRQIINTNHNIFTKEFIVNTIHSTSLNDFDDVLYDKVKVLEPSHRFRISHIIDRVLLQIKEGRYYNLRRLSDLKFSITNNKVIMNYILGNITLIMNGDDVYVCVPIRSKIQYE